MGSAFIVIAVISFAFAVFCVYFIFKQIEFVIVAVNLYRRMVRQQDSILKVLVDIRDSTRHYAPQAESDDVDLEVQRLPQFTQEELGDVTCANCKERIPLDAVECPRCQGSMPERKCKNCGTVVTSSVVNCPLCHAQLPRLE